MEKATAVAWLRLLATSKLWQRRPDTDLAKDIARYEQFTFFVLSRALVVQVGSESQTRGLLTGEVVSGPTGGAISRFRAKVMRMSLPDSYKRTEHASVLQIHVENEFLYETSLIDQRCVAPLQV